MPAMVYGTGSQQYRTYITQQYQEYHKFNLRPTSKWFIKETSSEQGFKSQNQYRQTVSGIGDIKHITYSFRNTDSISAKYGQYLQYLYQNYKDYIVSAASKSNMYKYQPIFKPLLHSKKRI